MSLFTIAWRSIQQRGLASALTMLSMALGVMLVVSVLAIHSVVSQSFRNNASLGYNMIVGAKGGKLQLTLNTVYYLSQPVENIPYTYYLEFLDAETRSQIEPKAGVIDCTQDGKFASYARLAIPVCLGDYVGNFRSVGTTPQFLDELTFGPEGKTKFQFAAGRNFQLTNEEHGYFEAVVGAVVAKELNLKLHDVIQPTHGDPETGHIHKEGFTVVGVLKPSGTPNDRAVFVNIEGFYLLEDHAKPVDEAAGDGHDEGSTEAAGDGHTGDDGAGHDHQAHGPLPVAQREVTAILVRTVNPLVAPGMSNMINEGVEAQAVLPVRQIFSLFDVIVRPIQAVLLALTAVICVVSGVSILVSIYNSMSERRHEIAVMRALGAGRGTVMTIILLESILLSVAGGAMGWLMAHSLIALASPAIEAQTGVSVHFYDVAPSEAWLIPALVLLAIACGLFPAVSAYRTDVAKSLGA